jgi:hypothetical protein
MTQYDFSVNGSPVVGNLSWNPNWTLNQLAITDPSDPGNQQTCNYTYDGLARLASGDCLLNPSGAQGWWQTFSSDAFGNLSKTGKGGGATSFLSTFTSSNQVSGAGYDADGRLTQDAVHSYSYGPYRNFLASIDSIGLTYAAMNRMVEQSKNGG